MKSPFRIKTFFGCLTIWCAISLSAFAQKKPLSLYSYQDKNGKYGFKDYDKDKVRIKPQYDGAMNWAGNTGGLYSVMMNGKWGYINSEGTLVVPYQYDKTFFLAVKLNNKWGLVEGGTGKVLIEPKYDSIDPINGTWCGVELNKKFGFVDRTGKVVIPIAYEEVRGFHNNIYKRGEGLTFEDNVNDLAAVKIKGHWGFINRNNHFVIPPIYTDVKSFSEGLVWVGSQGTYGAVDRHHVVCVPFEFTDPGYFSYGVAKATFQGLYGTVSNTGVFTYKNQSRQLHITQIGESADLYMVVGDAALEAANEQEALLWYNKAYEAKHKRAAFAIAELYDDDYSDMYDEETAYKWYKASASDKYMPGRIMYAVCNLQEISNDLTLPQAFSFLKKQCDLLTDSVLKKASEREKETVAMGMRVLADEYMEGKATTADKKAAFYWYNRSANLNNSIAMYEVGQCYQFGDGTPVDYKKAMEFYIAANTSDEFGMPRAMYRIGMLYHNGLGVPKDAAKGLEWLKKAADFGDKDAKAFIDKTAGK